MYVIVDRENLVFLHKHPRHDIIQDLRHIEVSHWKSITFPVDGSPKMLNFTDLELVLLYQNATGEKLHTGFSRLQLQQLVLDVAKQLPCSDVVPWEVTLQANSIPGDSEGFYRYVKGSTKPAKLEQLFVPPPLRSTGGAVPAANAPKAAPSAQKVHVNPNPWAKPANATKAV